MTRPRAFALVDHGLTGLAGHNLTYARRVLGAAGRLGLRTVAGVGEAAAGLDVGAASHPLFPRDVWANNPAEGRRWHAGAFMARRLGRAEATPPADAPPSEGGMAGAAADASAAPPTGRAARLLHGVREDWGVLLAARLGARAFAGELERVLDAAGLEAGDLVYLPTALSAELQGLDALLQRSAAARRLRWRVLLRYAPQAAPVRRSLAAAAQRLARRGLDIRLYSDTEPLCTAYARLCGAPCGLLPVPVEAAPVRRTPPRGTPLTVGYFGDARDEKGFDLIPTTVERVRRAAPADRPLRFVVQANLNTPAGEPLSRPARARLEAMAGEDLRLVGGPLAPDAYDALLGEVDIILLPYRPDRYGERSSGVLMEALTAGLPCVATPGAWMASVLSAAKPPAGVLTAAEPAALADGLASVAASWARYAEGAHALGVRLRPRTDPEALVRRLLAD